MRTVNETNNKKISKELTEVSIRWKCPAAHTNGGIIGQGRTNIYS